MLNKCTRENVKHVYVQGCLTGVLVGQCWKRVCGEMLTMSGENLENCWSRLRGGMQNSVRGGMISTRHVRECWTPNPYVRKKEDSEQVYEEECSRYNTCIWKYVYHVGKFGGLWTSVSGGMFNTCTWGNVQHVYLENVEHLNTFTWEMLDKCMGRNVHTCMWGTGRYHQLHTLLFQSYA